MKTWVKFYTEALHDRKMRKLNRVDKSVFYDLLLLAGQEDADGVLPPMEDIALELDMKVTECNRSVTRLVAVGLLTEGHNGDLTVTNFKERQETNLTGAEKTQRYRERLQEGHKKVTKVTEQSHTCDLNVTDEGHTCDPDVTEQSHTCDENVTPEEELRIKKKEEEEEDINNIALNINNSLVKNKHNAAKAAAREKTPKTKVSQDQPEFWQRAFGPEAERAQAFSAASGIVPIGTEFGRWQKDLRAFTEAGISIEQMTRAVKKVRQDGKYPIKAPGTVLTEARNLAAAPQQGRTFAEIADDMAEHEPALPEWDIEL